MMNTLPRFTMTAAALSFTLALAPPAFAQQQPAPQPEPQAAQEQAQAHTLDGELVNVDAEAKMITVKDADGVEQRIRYTDTTTVQGAQDGVAGLTNAAPTKVRITWVSSDDGPVAKSITVLPTE